jgi:hypothetical protein
MMKTISKTLVIIVAFLALSISNVFAASELTFDASATPTSLVLGDVNLFESNSSAGFYLNGTKLNSLSQSGNEITVSQSGGTPNFTFEINTYDNHVAIHLVDMSFSGTGADSSLTLKLYTQGAKAYTLNDLMEADSDEDMDLTWPYLWARARGDGSYGSVVLYNNNLSGSSLDAVLAEIWSTQAAAGHMVKPNVSSWTEADVLDWVDLWVEKFSVISEISVYPELDEDELYEMTNKYVIPLAATRVYMFQTAWCESPYTTVRSDIFPNGESDMLAYSDYLASNGVQLHLKNMTPQVLTDDEQYISSTYVDDRLMAWSSGTLEEDINSSSTTIQFRGDINLGFETYGTTGEMVYTYFRLGNELINVTSVSDTDDDVWVLTGCERGQYGTTAQSHSADDEMDGLVTLWGHFNFQEDFDLSNSLGEEIVGEYGNFLNDVSSDHLHFDGTSLNYPAWYTREYTDYVYSLQDQPTTGSTVGFGGLDAHFEMMFSEPQETSMMVGYYPVRIGPRLHGYGDVIETATSKLDIHFDISDGIMLDSRRLFFCGGFSGKLLTMALLDAYGLTDYCIELFDYWSDVAPVFTDADAAYYDEYLNKRDGSNHYTGPDALVLSKNDDDEYIITPHRVMGNDLGDEDNFVISQEWGAIAPWKSIDAGTTMEVENPYEAQQLQVIIWVDENSSALQDPLITVNGSGTLSVDGDIEAMEYMQFEGGNTVQVYDQNWNLDRTLPATVSNFTANKGTVSVKTAAGNDSTSADLKVQYITLGDEYVLEANDFITHENVAVRAVFASPKSNSITVGETVTLIATVLPTYAENKSVTWTSSKTSVATVSSTGVVTAVASGTATITVTTVDGNETATCEVTVTSGNETTTRYEAEDATITSGEIKTDTVASGGEYVDGSGGFNLSFSVPESGEATLSFNIASPSGARSMGVYVNEIKVDTVTASSSSWAVQTVSATLSSTNTIELRDSEGTSELDVDYLEVTVDPGVTSISVTGVQALNNNAVFTVSPNPVNDHFVIEMSDAQQATYTICNYVGKTVLFGGINGNSASISASDLPSGLYVIKVSTDNGIYLRKIIKK